MKNIKIVDDESEKNYIHELEKYIVYLERQNKIGTICLWIIVGLDLINFIIKHVMTL